MSPSPISPSRSAATAAPSATRAFSPTPAGNGLPPPPKPATQRQTSVSPTPRKRYTVALGGPITAPDELSPTPAPTADPKRGRGAGGRTKATTFDKNGLDDDDDDDSDFDGGEETIGKSAAARLASSGTLGVGRGSFGRGGDYKQANSESPSPMFNNRRVARAQSAYGFSNIAGSSLSSANMLSNAYTPTSASGIPSVAPLKPKLRSKSSERLHSHSNPGLSSSSSGTGDGMISSSLVSGVGGIKFVDPLVLRRQSRDSLRSTKPIAMPKPVGKIPIGQLVAFFDGDKK